MCCFPSRWHFFNLGDILTKKPVTPQDDKDCYKSLVSKNTKSCRHWVQIWSRTAKILFQISGPNQGSFAFAFRPLNISEAVWQRSENLKWKRPTLLYKATHVYTMQCNALEQQRKEPYDTMWPCIWGSHTTPWVALFPRNHKAISFCSNLTRPSTGVSSYCSDIFSAWLLKFKV